MLTIKNFARTMLLLGLCAPLLAPNPAFAQYNTNRPGPVGGGGSVSTNPPGTVASPSTNSVPRSMVLVNSEGVVTHPANFFAANSNGMVYCTITTNLASTNALVAMGSGSPLFNAEYTWAGTRYLKNGNTNFWITNKAGMWVSERNTTANVYSNATLTGLYVLGAGANPPPGVYFKIAVPTYATNYYIVGRPFAPPRTTEANVKDFGAKGDAIKLHAATVSSGVVICTNSAFTQADVGKVLVMYSTPTNTDFFKGLILTVQNATNATISTNVTQSTPYEAWYGTDDTTAISNALRSTSGDLVVTFPGGNYLCSYSSPDIYSGKQAVIHLPTDRSTGLLTNTSRTIVLRGSTPPMIYPSFVNAGGATTLGTPNTGTILLNFAKPVAGVTNVFVLHDGTGVGGSQFARERITFENLTLRQPGRPTHHAVYIARGGTTAFNDFAVDVDQSTNWLNSSSGQPPFYMEGIVSNANSVFAIYGPDPYNYAGMQLRNVTLSYHGTALRSGEHTVGDGAISFVGCGAGQYLDGAFGAQGTWTGSTMTSAFFYLCQYRIVVATNSPYRETAWYGNLKCEEGFPNVGIGPLVYDPLKRLSLSVGIITGTTSSTGIDSTNGVWYDSVNNAAYVAGSKITNGIVTGKGIVSLRTNSFTAADLPATGFGFWNSNGIGAVYMSFNTGGTITNKAISAP